MKKSLFVAFTLLAISLNAQIPDSLGVILPWDFVNVSSCDATMGQGPLTDNDGISIFLESDETLIDKSGNCIFRRKEWKILDWVGGKVYNHVQFGEISTDEVINCETNLFIDKDDFPIVITPSKLMLNEKEDHVYSFSYDDPNEDVIIINSSIQENQEVFVYDLTNNSVCKTNVYITSCEEDIKLEFPETANLTFQGEPYIELTEELLGIEIEYPCAPYETIIRIGNQSDAIMAAQQVGKIVPVTIEVEIENGPTFKRYMHVIVSGVKPEPKSLFIEDKSFESGETIELDIWSDGIEGLVAWQFQIEFSDAEIIEIRPSDIFEDIPSNILEDDNVLRALWTPLDGLPLNAESNMTWFTIVLEAKVTGTTKDIFKSVEDPWSLIGIEDENYIHEFEAEFEFNIASRNVLGNEEANTFSEIEVFPNPASVILNITGYPSSNLPILIEIYDLQGRLTVRRSINNYDSALKIDISHLDSGIYILKTQLGKRKYSQKIIKI